jgi:sialic acid synthase SpsE
VARVAQIILDYSANTFKNDKKLIKRGIDEIKKIDSGKHEIVFKTQLFIKAGDNIPCTHESFEYLYEYGNSQGYKVTASVFDKESLEYLLKFDVPFIKIANRPDLYWLKNEILEYKQKNNIPQHSEPLVYMSFNKKIEAGLEGSYAFYCVSEYPAKIDDYPSSYKLLSDHTEGLDLFIISKPEKWEKHYKLSDSTGLDAGSFAVTAEDLKEIL